MAIFKARTGKEEQATTEAAGTFAPAPPDAATTRLGQQVVAQCLVTPERLAEAFSSGATTVGKLAQRLVDHEALRPAAVLAAAAAASELPTADLRNAIPEPAALEVLSEADARRLQALPLRVLDLGVEVVVAEPAEEHRAEIARVIGRPVSCLLALPSDLRDAIDRAFRADADIQRLIKVFEATEEQRSAVAAAASGEDLTGDEAPVVQVVNRIVAQALRDRASDVHIEALGDHVRVRFRVDGTLVDSFTLPLNIHAALVSRLKIMGGMNIVERRRPQDGQFSTVIDGREVDVRAASVATVFGEKVVLRLLDKSRSLYGLSELGFPRDTYLQYSQLVHSPFGMVICAGPTGAGKTTTLYATLQEINSTGKNVMTVEDPVEYVFPGINQIQTNEQAGISFAHGLKAILRQDPDVILVGEIRDADTARIAIQSALTGHFVLSSLHGTDAVAALHRFLDMGIESFLIASSVVGVVGQRLLRRLCDSCKEPYTPSAESLAFYEQHGGRPKDVFWHGSGCNFCSGTGYRDRIGVYELLRITPEMRRLVVGWATQEELRRLATAQGMRTLTQEAISLVEQDVTSIPEVIRTLFAA
jgi:type IV pilus assembly protein PilB